MTILEMKRLSPERLSNLLKVRQIVRSRGRFRIQIQSCALIHYTTFSEKSAINSFGLRKRGGERERKSKGEEEKERGGGERGGAGREVIREGFLKMTSELGIGEK